jgi:NosR/NirI family nitrous oxide reductase transcriptional regulator
MRTSAILALVLGSMIAVQTQAPVDPKLQGQLKTVFPSASSFSPKEGDPPHFKAFKMSANPASPDLAGFVFWTTELEPLERGYDGPIKMLVGMDTSGVLTGVLVVQHHEPYGNFSVEPPAFAAQFKGKSIRDAFKVGVDVNAVSSATISITSATRAIRNSARRVATRLLASGPAK